MFQRVSDAGIFINGVIRRRIFLADRTGVGGPIRSHTGLDAGRAANRGLRWLKAHPEGGKPPAHIAEKITVLKQISAKAGV